MVAFTIDVGNTERLTGGFKDMASGKVLDLKLENVGSVDFGCGRTVFYTETNEHNRPYVVKKMDLSTGRSTTLFVDDDPTHYLDIGITKDKKFMVINSNTKEDSEVWVTERVETTDSVLPRKLVPRVAGVMSHVDHLRDMFVAITTLGTKQKSFKIATLQTTDTEWKDLLPFEDPNLVI
jgi:protease II